MKRKSILRTGLAAVGIGTDRYETASVLLGNIRKWTSFFWTTDFSMRRWHAT